MAATPLASRALATSAEIPQPTSLAITGTLKRSASSASLSKRDGPPGLPSACTTSWSGLRCTARASASIMATRRSRASSGRPWATSE